MGGGRACLQLCSRARRAALSDPPRRSRPLLRAHVSRPAARPVGALPSLHSTSEENIPKDMPVLSQLQARLLNHVLIAIINLCSYAFTRCQDLHVVALDTSKTLPW